MSAPILLAVLIIGGTFVFFVSIASIVGSAILLLPH